MSKTNKKQVVGGAILSYILIILNTLYGMVITPYILSRLGTEEYGVYKTIAALSSALMVLDLGVGGTVTRYIAKYKAENNDDEIPNFLFIIFIETIVISLFVAGVCCGTYFLIGPIYSASFTLNQLGLAQKLFIILSCNMIFHIIENVINGIITGYNDFLFGNGIKLIRLLFRIILIFVVLCAYPNAVALVLIDLLLTVLFVIVEICWAFFKHHVRIKYRHIDKQVFRESFIYTMVMFATTIISQINGNLDNVIIGAVIGASAVTVYSMGLTIFGMYEQISTSVSGVMLPSVSNLLQEEDGLKKAENLVIKAGRIQFILLGAVFAGFIVLGREFIFLWLGEGFEDVYGITLILMGPALFYLCVNVCLSILRAKNLLNFRAIVLLCTTVLNVFITYFGTKMYGYYAACIGTSVSLIIGVLICMNIYYYKVLKFNMVKIYAKIIKGSIIPILISSLVVWAIHKWLLNGSWIYLILNIIIFCIVYFGLVYFIGFTKEEKKQLHEKFRRKKEI